MEEIITKQLKEMLLRQMTEMRKEIVELKLNEAQIQQANRSRRQGTTLSTEKQTERESVLENPAENQVESRKVSEEGTRGEEAGLKTPEANEKLEAAIKVKDFTKS